MTGNYRVQESFGNIALRVENEDGETSELMLDIEDAKRLVRDLERHIRFIEEDPDRD